MRPSLLASPFAVGSNPVSLLAWVGEEFLDWTYGDLPIGTVLDSVSLYLFTNCFATSIYPYRHLFTPRVVGAHENSKWHINKPLGFSWFPQDLAPIPAAWVAETGNLVFVRHHNKVIHMHAVPKDVEGESVIEMAVYGGHFAAVEQPDVLWTDLEDFVT
jgi:microsomal epoxide hydrolase